MELYSPEFFSSLFAIVVVNLLLSGDNAIVIALAARSLPPQLRTKAIVWGTVGAIAVRTAMTMIVVWLLQIPGLLLAGGLLLLWIAYKLLVDSAGDNHEVSSGSGFWSAIRTIMVADAVMGLDNVLAVAGVAHGSFVLVVLGLVTSIPIVIFGSQLVLKVLQKYPVIIYVGAAVLAWTAVKMLTHEPLVHDYFDAMGVWLYGFYGLVVAGVLAAGFRSSQASHTPAAAR